MATNYPTTPPARPVVQSWLHALKHPIKALNMPDLDPTAIITGKGFREWVVRPAPHENDRLAASAARDQLTARIPELAGARWQFGGRDADGYMVVRAVVPPPP